MLTLCTLWCLIADGNARTVAGYDANGSAQGNEALRIAAAFLYMAAVSVVLFICVFSFKPLADTLAGKATDACLSKGFGGQRKVILQRRN